MREYKVYFKIFNKNLVTTVTASSINEAKEIVIKNIKFLKIVSPEDPVDFLKNIFGI